jgi:hypothetical protein
MEKSELSNAVLVAMEFCYDTQYSPRQKIERITTLMESSRIRWSEYGVLLYLVAERSGFDDATAKVFHRTLRSLYPPTGERVVTEELGVAGLLRVVNDVGEYYFQARFTPASRSTLPPGINP